MKKMVLFVLLWQGYATASDSELCRLLAPHQPTSMSMGAAVPLVNLNGDCSTSSVTSRTDLEEQKESLKQSSSTRDCKRVAALLITPGLCAVGGAAGAGVAFNFSYYWGCGGALSGLVFSLPSVPLVAKGYDRCVDQPIIDETKRINEERRRINEPLEMKEEA